MLFAGAVIVVSSFVLLAAGESLVSGEKPIFEDSFKDASQIQSMQGVRVANGQVTLDGSLLRVDPIRNPTLALGLVQTDRPNLVGAPDVLRVGSSWYMYYHEATFAVPGEIHVATSTDGLTWSPNNVPVISPAPGDITAAYPDVLYVGGAFQMWYGSFDGNTYVIRHATSSDGVSWSSGTVVLGTDMDAGITYWSTDPWVLFDGTQYTMWYWSIIPYVTSVIRYATSLDGVNWNHIGVVLRPMTLDGIAFSHVGSGAVVRESTDFVMWYRCSTGTNDYICRARSLDGLIWAQEGIALAPSQVDPTQDQLVTMPSAIRLDDGSYRVYYESRGSVQPYGIFPGDQIWVGTTTSGGQPIGSITSVTIPARAGGKYRSLEASWSIPGGTSLTIDILDASGNPIPGFTGLTANEFALTGISGRTYPAIELRANFVGTSTATPVLKAWEAF